MAGSWTLQEPVQAPGLPYEVTSAKREKKVRRSAESMLDLGHCMGAGGGMVVVVAEKGALKTWGMW